jgi:hypothetical protein
LASGDETMQHASVAQLENMQCSIADKCPACCILAGGEEIPSRGKKARSSEGKTKKAKKGGSGERIRMSNPASTDDDEEEAFDNPATADGQDSPKKGSPRKGQDSPKNGKAGHTIEKKDSTGVRAALRGVSYTRTV